MDRIGKYIKRIPSPNTNRTTIFTTFNYAFQNYYSNDFNYIPNPVVSSDYNCYIAFYSREPGEVTVDWGDGNTEVFKMRKASATSYIASWRTLNVDYRKNPASTGGGWSLGIDQETGEYIHPYPNHHYADDDIDKERSVTMTFTCDIVSASFNTTVHHSFPILEMTTLESLSLSDNKYIMEIPYSRITKLKNLKSLYLNRLGGTLQYIPDSIFDMTGLTSLTLSGVVNLTNIDSSNIRKIGNLKQLTNLSLNTTWLPQYIKEFNDLPNIVTLDIAPNYLPDVYPKFDEVTQINQNLISLNFMGSGWIAGRTRTTWAEQISGKGIDKLQTLDASYAPNLTWDFPEFIKEMRSMSSFSINFCTPTVARADLFVNNFYTYITGWTQTTMNGIAKDGKRNQFYGLYINMWGPSEPNANSRPSGTEQAPAGFVKGSSNGNPATPMEKIYVLKNNYGQSWNIKPINA